MHLRKVSKEKLEKFFEEVIEVLLIADKEYLNDQVFFCSLLEASKIVYNKHEEAKNV